MPMSTRTPLPIADTLLLFDIDGTLAPIVDDPDAARVPEALIDLLTVAGRRAHDVGVVTGRSLDAARRMVPVDGIWIAACHGMHTTGPAGDEWIDPAAQRARQQLALAVTMAQTVGWRYEDKGACVTLHFRHAERPAQTAAQMRAQIATVLDPTVVELHDARMALEVRPVGAAGKGEAVRRLLTASAARGVVYVGDDRTDLDAFAALEHGDVQAFRVAVNSSEVPADLVESADLVLDDQSRVEPWLRSLLAGE